MNRSVLSDGEANDPLLDDVDQWYLYRTNTDPGALAEAELKFTATDDGRGSGAGNCARALAQTLRRNAQS